MPSGGLQRRRRVSAAAYRGDPSLTEEELRAAIKRGARLMYVVLLAPPVVGLFGWLLPGGSAASHWETACGGFVGMAVLSYFLAQRLAAARRANRDALSGRSGDDY